MAENTRPAWQDRQQQKETKGQTGNNIKTKCVKTFIVLFDFEAGVMAEKARSAWPKK